MTLSLRIALALLLLSLAPTAHAGYCDGVLKGESINDVQASNCIKLSGTYTFATLPNSTSIKVGTTAYTSDLGTVTFTSAGWSPIGAAGLVNLETIAYANNIATNGGVISSQQLAAVDDFISNGKTNGWWSTVLDMGVFAGQNLSAALVKLKYPSGGQGTITNHNFVATDYTQANGVVAAANNSTKYLDTGFIPNANGLTSTNYAMGAFWSAEVAQGAGSGYTMGGNPASGDTTVIAGSTTGTGFTPAGSINSNGANSLARGFLACSIDTTTEHIFMHGAEILTAVTSPVLETASNITIFRVTRFGGLYYGGGGISFYFIGNTPTSAQMQSLGLAVELLMRRLGRVSTSRPGTMFVGDSIISGTGLTNQSNRWPAIVSEKDVLQEINAGVPAGSASGTIANVNPLSSTGPGYLNQPFDQAVVMIGTNDFDLLDTTNTGSATIQGNWASAVTSFINGVRALPARVVLTTIPYNTTNANSVDAKFQSWNTYIANFATIFSTAGQTNPVQLVDVYTIYRAKGATAANALLQSDLLHPTDAGAVLIGTAMAQALLGSYHIDFTDTAQITFATIANGAHASVALTIYGVVAGQQIDVVPLSASVLTLTATATATNTVTVTATNTSGSSFTGAAVPLRVTIFL